MRHRTPSSLVLGLCLLIPVHAAVAEQSNATLSVGVEVIAGSCTNSSDKPENDEVVYCPPSARLIQDGVVLTTYNGVAGPDDVDGDHIIVAY